MQKVKKFIKECKSYSYKDSLFSKRWILNYDIQTVIKCFYIDYKDDKVFTESLIALDVAVDNMTEISKSMTWEAFKILMKPILIIDKKYKK